MILNHRQRRLRTSSVLRKMVRETRMDRSALIYPMFVVYGERKKEEIDSMPGQYRYSVDQLPFALEAVAEAGIPSVMLFGIPEKKDEEASEAWMEDGIIQAALKKAKEKVPELYYIADTCMCEYTSHGHCGILDGEYVDNDKTVEYLSKIALSQVQAGADMVAPSDMMDGRIGAIRMTLDSNGYVTTPIMSYAAKYASAFYGPFRDAAGSAPSFGDRKSYQMDYHNRKEAWMEIVQDVDQGADIVMVKPALSYLDVIREAAESIQVPIASYSVSGEYAMIKAAASLGYVDEDSLICETATSMFRAGSDLVISYYAKEIAKFMREGRIG